MSDDGRIFALGNLGESWSPRSWADVRSDVERGRCAYLVPRPDGDVVVALDGLRGHATTLLALLELPPC